MAVQSTEEVVRVFDEWGRHYAPSNVIQNEKNAKLLADYVFKTYGLVSITYLSLAASALASQLDLVPEPKQLTQEEKAAIFQKREFTRHQKDQLENSEAAFFERAKRAEEAKRTEKEAAEQVQAENLIRKEIMDYECYRGPNMRDVTKTEAFRNDLFKIEVRRNRKRDAKLTLEAVRKAISNLP